MFVSGKIRGNAPQLADYLLTIGENERIVILDVDGRPHADAKYLKDTLRSMELNSELTRSNNSVYHAIIRPDPQSQSDRAMTMEEWHRATELLAQELPFKEQRRATVLHEKDGYYHAHVVFERYDHERGAMVDYKHNYKAHDVARFQMEKEFGHNKTPQKNPDRANHKKTLTQIWKETNTGKEFIKQARENGYQVAKGTDRPFRVVDSNGISFDLVRQLDGIKTKEVRERLDTISLMDDKKAIELMQNYKKEKQLREPPKHQLAIIDARSHIAEPIAKTVNEAEVKPQSQVDNNHVSEAKDQRDRQIQRFLEEMRKAKEQNERKHGMFRTLCISAVFMLQVTARYLLSPPSVSFNFQQKQTSIVNFTDGHTVQNAAFLRQANRDKSPKNLINWNDLIKEQREAFSKDVGPKYKGKTQRQDVNYEPEQQRLRQVQIYKHT